MLPSAYLDATRSIAEECRKEISLYGLANIRAQLNEIPEDQALLWLTEHRKELLALLDLTPKQRAKRLSGLPADERGLWLLGVYRLAKVAYETMRALNFHPLTAGMSYRSAAGEAAELGLQIFEQWPDLFPFDAGEE